MTPFLPLEGRPATYCKYVAGLGRPMPRDAVEQWLCPQWSVELACEMYDLPLRNAFQPKGPR